MKQTKKPTRAHKELMVKNKLNPDNWRVVSETAKELAIMLGVTPETVRKNYSEHNRGVRTYHLKYKIVKVEDAVEDEPAAVVKRQ